MQCNVGKTDRAIRILAGLVLIALTVTNVIGYWGWIGIVPLLTGTFRICPAYWIFKLNTNK